MAVSSHDVDLSETISRAREQTDELHRYNHRFQVLGYGIVEPDKLKDDYGSLVPQSYDNAVEMLENQSEEVADQWIDTHETVERELLYLFPKYETAFQETVMGERQDQELEELFNIDADIETYNQTVEKVLQINNDYKVIEHMIEDLSRSLESEDYTSPREIRLEKDRWYSHHIERLDQLDIVPASELQSRSD